MILVKDEMIGLIVNSQSLKIDQKTNFLVLWMLSEIAHRPQNTNLHNSILNDLYIFSWTETVVPCPSVFSSHKPLYFYVPSTTGLRKFSNVIVYYIVFKNIPASIKHKHNSENRTKAKNIYFNVKWFQNRSIFLLFRKCLFNLKFQGKKLCKKRKCR